MLNDLIIRKLAVPAAGVVQYSDGKIPGFGVRVTSNGIKTYYLAYRHHGKNRRLGLGRYPAISLQRARGKAFAALAELEEGRDPSNHLAKAEGFEGALETFVTNHCHRNNRASTAAETERLLRVHFLPEWKRRNVNTITKADVSEVLEPVIKRGSVGSARHAFAAVRKFFNWLVEQGSLDASPCMGMRAPGKPGNRDRVLNDQELIAVWSGALKIGQPFGPIAQLLMLTAQRRGEVVGMVWAEIDEANKLWTIPGERTKNSKPHAVPLCTDALAIIKAQPRTKSPYVFPARGKPDQPYSGYSKGKRELDVAAKLKDWTLHDLRRTAATGMASLGVAPHVVERVLNHVSGSFAGVAGIYNRFQYAEEMRDGLTKWESHLAKLASSKSGVI